MSDGRKRRTMRGAAVAAAGVGLVAAPLALMGGTAFAAAPTSMSANAALVAADGAASVPSGGGAYQPPPGPPLPAPGVPLPILAANNDVGGLANITIAEPANSTAAMAATPVTVTLTNATFALPPFANTPTVTASDGSTPTVTPPGGSASLIFTPARGASPTATYTVSNVMVNLTLPAGGKFKAGTKVEATVTQPNNPNFPATKPVVVGVTTTLDVTTFAGKNEDTTAADVYNQEIATGAIATQSLVLATDANFPDALSAAYLAKAHDAGILLSPPGALSGATKNEILAHHPTTIYVLGGTVAISTTVTAQINALYPSTSPPRIVRLGGVDQFATNQLVDNSVATTGTPLDLTAAFTHASTYNTSGGNESTSGPAVGTAKTAIVASGTSFPDALAASALANKDGIPIVLTLGNTLSPTAKAQLTSLGAGQVIVVGGPAAVSDSVVSAINGAVTAGGLGLPVLRVGGVDATDTARLFASFEQSVAGFATGGPTYVARGDYYTDALVSAPYLAKLNAPLLLTEDPNTAGPYLTRYLTAQAATAPGGATPSAASMNAFSIVQFGGTVALDPNAGLGIELALAAGVKP